MITKKTFIKVIPAVALACGALAFNFLGNGNELVETKAANYTTSNRSLTFNSDKSIGAEFNVEGNDLDMKGWLICLYDEKPEFNPVTRKLINSDSTYPYVDARCKHYYFVENTTQNGNISITWASSANDQKTAWSTTGSTLTTGKTLGDVLGAQDWYIVIGPRHYHDSTWTPDGNEHGQGNDDGIWENGDYYVGQKSVLEDDKPSGEIYLDLTENLFWDTDDAKFAVYFWDGLGNKGYSTFASEVPEYQTMYVASYELSFTPTNMLALRLKPETPEPTTSETYVWNQTKDLPFYDNYSVIGVQQSDSWTNPLSRVEVDGKTDIILDHYKRNLSNKSEHYNDQVDLAVGDKFVIGFFGSKYNAFTAHSLLKDAFKKTGNKIEVVTAGSYAFYFDTTEGSRSVYITTPTIAAADKWAQLFMSDDCPYTPEVWDGFSQSFKKLAPEVKALFVEADHFDPKADLKSDSYVNQAVQRYDYLINTYHYDNFMERTYPEESNTNVNSLKTKNVNVNAIVIIVGVSATAILAGALFLLKKKKYE